MKQSIIITLSIGVFLYLASAFIVMDFNPYYWGIPHRALIPFVWVILSLFVSGAYHDLIKK